ncbi:hypothetical protein DPMN_099023 [Dreissena polymorpha]|uniref:Uncharacterized protein n=1 Tax=Dreissena polymorpha TaxID=45954 RepID=A0A9D4LE52_DREPO|nr:hypothetical protein DPMN_099023 [Dreissena polymorpha]
MGSLPVYGWPNVKLVPICAQKAAVAVGGRGHTFASSSLEDHVPQIQCGPISQQEYLAELMNRATVDQHGISA